MAITRRDRLLESIGSTWIDKRYALVKILFAVLLIQIPPIVLIFDSTRRFDFGGRVPDNRDPLMIIVAGVASFGESVLLIISAGLLTACGALFQFFFFTALVGIAAAGTGVFGIFAMARAMSSSVCDVVENTGTCEFGLREALAGSCWKAAVCGPIYLYVSYWYFFKIRPEVAVERRAHRSRLENHEAHPLEETEYRYYGGQGVDGGSQSYYAVPSGDESKGPRIGRY